MGNMGKMGSDPYNALDIAIKGVGKYLQSVYKVSKGGQDYKDVGAIAQFAETEEMESDPFFRTKGCHLTERVRVGI